ncbi:hypothetical protein BDF21DRAFT_375938 [Thamnidium elegans]|nr:hypothetical protein BDF21DRAFT_375938 [Thamnidium elegans]
MDFEYLSFNEQDDSDELTGEVTVSLMSMMRAKYEIENFVSTLAKEKSIKKERSTYRSYNTDQISRFLTLVTEQVSVKEAALDAGITKNTAYRFKK